MPVLTVLRAQLLIPVALFCVCLLPARFLRSRYVRALVAVLAGVFACVAAFGALLALHGHMLSSSLATTAVAYAHGQPLYHAASSAERYALLYGPLSFLVYLPAAVVSADLRAFQIWTAVPATAAIALIWWIARGLSSPTARALIVLQGSLVLIAFAKFEWAPRADIWIVFFCALGLYAAYAKNSVGSVLGMVCAGAAVLDCKLSTALLAFLPPLVFWTRTRKALPPFLAAALILPLSAAVFLLPGVSLWNYGYWLGASAKHGLVGSLLLLNALAAFNIFLVPLFLWLRFWVRGRTEALAYCRAHMPLVAGIGVAAAGCVFTGAKRGAGPWHCVPLVPIACLCSAKLLRKLEALASSTQQKTSLHGFAASLALALVLLGVRNLRVIVPEYRLGQPPSSSAVAADLQRIIAAFPQKDIEMGYGSGSYELSWQRSLLVASGSHHTLDLDSLADMELSNLPLPAATVRYIEQCKADAWLVPKGEEPFTIGNPYHEGAPQVPAEAFPAYFRSSFQQHYRRSSQSEFYDLYTCRR